MRKKKIMIVFIVTSLLLYVLPPYLAPMVFKNTSPKSAIRNYLQQEGHPYRSFLSIIIDQGTQEPENVGTYNVLWFDWDSEGGKAGQFCFTEERGTAEYTAVCVNKPS